MCRRQKKQSFNELILNKLKQNQQNLQQLLEQVLNKMLNTCSNNIYYIYENENENENNKKGGLLRGEKKAFVEPFAEICSDFVDEKICEHWQRWKKFFFRENGKFSKKCFSENANPEFTIFSKFLKINYIKILNSEKLTKTRENSFHFFHLYHLCREKSSE